MTGEIQLSKWWRTPSAQAAIKRAADQRRERIEQMKASFKARKEQLEREVWEQKGEAQ